MMGGAREMARLLGIAMFIAVRELGRLLEHIGIGGQAMLGHDPGHPVMPKRGQGCQAARWPCGDGSSSRCARHKRARGVSASAQASADAADMQNESPRAFRAGARAREASFSQVRGVRADTRRARADMPATRQTDAPTTGGVRP